MHTARRRTPDYKLSAGTAAQLRALDHMSVGELADQFRALFGFATRSRNKQYLRKRLAWRIQELALGGLSPRALKQIEQLAPQAPVRWQVTLPPQRPDGARGSDPRLPAVGEHLSRRFNGIDHVVTVLEDGFQYGGKHYRSLSQIATTITGTAWNGFRFFGLTPHPPERAS